MRADEGKGTAMLSERLEMIRMVEGQRERRYARV